MWNCGHHQRCYPTKATARFLIFSRRGAEFLNLANGDVGLNNWTRGACGYGVMPANGLTYAPPHNCACYPEAKLFGFNALAPKRELPADGPPRLEPGPAYSAAVDASTPRSSRTCAGAGPTINTNPRTGPRQRFVSMPVS